MGTARTLDMTEKKSEMADCALNRSGLVVREEHAKVR